MGLPQDAQQPVTNPAAPAAVPFSSIYHFRLTSHPKFIILKHMGAEMAAVLSVQSTH